jgi:hypothetical protein
MAVILNVRPINPVHRLESASGWLLGNTESNICTQKTGTCEPHLCSDLKTTDTGAFWFFGNGNIGKKSRLYFHHLKKLIKFNIWGVLLDIFDSVKSV